MTFTEWYKHTYKADWHEDYALLYRYAGEMLDKYDDWCDSNNITPTYDG